MLYIDVGLRAPDQETLDEVMPVIHKAAEMTCKEKGCLTYRFTFDTHDPMILRVTELWESEEDLLAHFEGEGIRMLLPALKRLERLGLRGYQGDFKPYEVPLPTKVTSR